MFPLGSLVSKAPELWTGRIIGAGVTFGGTRVYMVQMLSKEVPRIFLGTEANLSILQPEDEYKDKILT